MPSGTPRPRSVKSLTPRFCIHCGHNGRGPLAAPNGGWIHPQCLRTVIRELGKTAMLGLDRDPERHL